MAVRKLPTATFAAVISVTAGFTPVWEGMDVVAKKDMIGTGHPMTYCYGQTDEFGKVKAGTRFTKQQCDEFLAKSLPKYLDPIVQCVKVDGLPVKVWAALTDAAYNAGPARVCKSPMVAKINAGNVAAACEAFDGWIVTSDHVVRRGLVARRAGEKHGDHRKSERALCLEGVKDSQVKRSSWSILVDKVRS
jgi:lysozyme